MSGKRHFFKRGRGEISSIRPRATETFALSLLQFFLFLMSSSLVFTAVFEWDRYQIIMGARGEALSVLDKALLAWLLVAKSLAWFLPILPLLAILVLAGLRRTAGAILCIAWVGVFYLMAGDLISVGFAGYHFWDYFPHIQDIFENPGQNIAQWAGDRLTTEALIVFGIFTVIGPLWLMCTNVVARNIARRFPRITQTTAMGTLAAVMILTTAGVVPSLEYFQDINLLDSVYATLPFTPGMRASCAGVIAHLTHPLGKPHHPPTTASLTPIPSPLKQRGWDKDFAGDPKRSLSTPASDPAPAEEPMPLWRSAEKALRSAAEVFSQGSGFGSVGSLQTMEPPLNAPAFLRKDSPRTAGSRTRSKSLRDEAAAGQGPLVRRRDELTAQKIAYDAANPGPADQTAFVNKPDLPNIIMVIFESFRHSALSPSLMKELDAWSYQGLRLNRHYSGSNCSHLGLFSLFYSRSPLGYHQTLDRKVPPQMLASLRDSGYQITFLTSGEVKGFRRLHQFINRRTCDEVITEGDFILHGMKDWPDSDRKKLAHAREIVTSGRNKPQFVFFYLVSSHFRYPFPPEFEIYKEQPTFWQFLNARDQITNHLNRYANATLFLEHELLKLLKSIDLKRNIVIVTGDHGESMGEDGVFTHASKMSEIQLRVPCALVGGGIQPQVVSTATAHMDLLPTLLHALAGKTVPVHNIHGRDLIADAAPADEVVLVPANGPDWEGLVLIREKDRLAFKTSTSDPENVQTEFAGLIDEYGRFEWKVGQPYPPRHARE